MILKQTLFGLGMATLLFTVSCTEEEPTLPPPPPVPAQNSNADEPELKPIDAVANPQSNSATAKVQMTAGNSSQGTSGAFVIQVDIKPSMKAAEKAIAKLSTQGITAYAAEVENPGELEGTYYRVRIGYFSNRKDAETFAKGTLEPAGYAWWVDLKSNDDVGSPAVNEDSGSSWTPSETARTPEPVVTKPEPQPEPVVVKEEPKPQPKPEPVVVKEEPKPQPKVESKPQPTPAAEDDEWQ